MRRVVTVFVFLIVIGFVADRLIAGEPSILWTTGDRLLPAWGFFPNGASYGDTSPSGKAAAWTAGGGTHVLTWVADVPTEGPWQVWVRQYGGYGKVTVTVDERPVGGARGGPGGGRYVWRHLGEIEVAAGTHHVDLTVNHGMLDAVLFTNDAALDPAKTKLPEPVESPALRGLRAYRDDGYLSAAAGSLGFVVGSVTPYAEVHYDWLPELDDLGDRISLWGAAGQYVANTFAVRAVKPIESLRASLEEIVGPEGTKLGPEAIDLRVVHVRHRSMTLPATRRYSDQFPDLLLRDDRTGVPPEGNQGGFGGGTCVAGVPAHRSRQFWITVSVPAGSPSGMYRGTLVLSAEESPQVRKELHVELEVLTVDLRPVEGYYSIYYPSQPVKPERKNYVSAERYRAELQDQVRHGLNSTTLYGGFETLPMAAEAGMTRAPCVMHWPGGKAAEQINAARDLGFDGLLYYGVDEPRTPEQVDRCLREARRRREQGLPMFTAINSTQAQEALGTAVSHPVYNIKVFGGPDNPVVLHAREQGNHVISYWTTQTAFPLYYRALAGLYNTRCGYEGTAPWAYQDYPDARLYSEPAHAVAYPDAAGQPIPTLRWEALRDGIDDVRYLQALDRAIAAAEGRLAKADLPADLATALEQARQVRHECYESISGRWFQYTGNLLPGDLDQVRRRLADATVALRLPMPISATALGADKRFVQLTGWGGGKPEEIVAQAAEVGFDEIIVWNHDPQYLSQLVALGREHNVGIYASLYLGDVKDWKERRPGVDPPLQEMNNEENAALARIQADTTKGKSGYQYGGEPVHGTEVLSTPVLCFHHPEVRLFFEEQIRDLLKIPGLRGIAMDYFGYQNYRCCHCPNSTKAFEAWRQRHPDLPLDKARNRFSLETLVNFVNGLARYARSEVAEAKVACHVYPVFLPEPLYGNRLDVDFCGQTAAWYFEPLWSYEKIRAYTQVICGEEKKHFARPEGVAMIGVYTRPALYPVKSPERLTGELQAILDGGGDRVQVCSLNDVLNDPATREVFRRMFRRGEAAGEARASDPDLEPAQAGP